MKALCVMCMAREGDPRNGGLCYTCAPRLKLRWARSRSGRPLSGPKDPPKDPPPRRCGCCGAPFPQPHSHRNCERCEAEDW